MTGISLPHRVAGSGEPVVVLPGLAGRTGVPAFVARLTARLDDGALAKHRTVWAIDRRYGLEPGITVAELAAECARELSTNFAAPVDLVGISTGGSIALQLTADHPELVRRLVLLSSAHALSARGRQTQARIAALLRAGRPRAAAALFLGNTGASAPARALLGAIGFLLPRVVVGHDDADLLVTLDAEDGFDLVAALPTITTPTLIVGGRHDRFYSAELFAATHDRLPNATLEVVPRAGHLGLAGNDRLGRRILAFLDA